MIKRTVQVGLLYGLTCMAQAQSMTPTQIEQYQHLITEIRCVTCQHQSIAESQAPVAIAMRESIAEQIIAGHNNTAIRAKLRESYGEYVSFRPMFHLQNALLWLGPLLFIAIAGLLLKRMTAHSHA